MTFIIRGGPRLCVICSDREPTALAVGVYCISNAREEFDRHVFDTNWIRRDIGSPQLFISKSIPELPTLHRKFRSPSAFQNSLSGI